MTAAGAALRFPRNTRLTGPAGSEALKKTAAVVGEEDDYDDAPHPD